MHLKKKKANQTLKPRTVQEASAAKQKLHPNLIKVISYSVKEIKKLGSDCFCHVLPRFLFISPSLGHSTAHPSGQ